MNHRTHSRKAFTLLELLVASALAVVIMGLAVNAYRHSQRLIRRAETLLRLHRVAGDVAERWEKDASSLMQHVACNATTTSVSGVKNLVQFTGMHTLSETFDSKIYDRPSDTDMAWVRWEWRAADRRLSRAESPSPHWVTTYPNAQMSYVENSVLKPVVGMRPNPVRTYGEFTSGFKKWFDPLSPDPSIARSTRIYDLLFLTGTDVDGTTRTYGGFGAEMSTNAAFKVPNDLLAASPAYLLAAAWSTLPVPNPRRPLAEDVRDCTISYVLRDGTEVIDANQSTDGQTQDGSGASTRPAVLRLSFTLCDRSSGLSQSFTFSAKAPQ